MGYDQPGPKEKAYAREIINLAKTTDKHDTLVIENRGWSVHLYTAANGDSEYAIPGAGDLA